jgi:hypothetical protein
MLIAHLGIETRLGANPFLITVHIKCQMRDVSWWTLQNVNCIPRAGFAPKCSSALLIEPATLRLLPIC